MSERERLTIRDEAEGSGAQTLERGLAILFLAARQDGTVTAERCMSELHLTRSTAYRLIKVLRDLDLLVPGPTAGAYSLGPAVERLAGGISGYAALRATCRTYLERISRETHETALLTVVQWPSALCLDRFESTRPLRLSFEVGALRPLYAGASAKILLAYEPPARLEAYLRQVELIPIGPGTLTQPDAVRAEMARIRALGYAESESETDDGVSGSAAAVFGPDGRCVAALSVAGPTHRFDREAARRAVVEAARAVTTSLGGRVPKGTGR
ncbi:MAG: IclR family transcriptional regulator [Actinomycetia bacterium]|nr:IclR family transcriptional regulator [Actinomycetes bacterium]